MSDATALSTRVAAVQSRIADAGGDPEKIRMVAVTKGFGVQAVREALDAGLVDIGESYVQELSAKVADLGAEAPPGQPSEQPQRPRWHLIGRLQRNKVRKAAPHVALWQSVDRLALGSEIARRAPGAAVLVQVNVTGEEAKGGCPPASVAGLVQELAQLGLDVQGLMTIGPQGPPEAARAGFAQLRELADELGLAERSMGMSDDLDVAVQEGATMVRVGSALFGPRPGHPGVRH
jgi:PLP dependent protein